jgi:hypothetical protein
MEEESKREKERDVKISKFTFLVIFFVLKSGTIFFFIYPFGTLIFSMSMNILRQKLLKSSQLYFHSSCSSDFHFMKMKYDNNKRCDNDEFLVH